MYDTLKIGRYQIRTAKSAGELRAIEALRRRAFDINPLTEQADNHYDKRCTQFLVECSATGALVCSFRLLGLSDGSELSTSYSGQFYDLSALSHYSAPMVELGRFCIEPGLKDPDIVRAAWAALTRYVDEAGVGMLFGCSSFRGTNTDKYLNVFNLLNSKNLAPQQWAPRVKAAQVYKFSEIERNLRQDPRAARLSMPSLLRTYLLMGGWVSDHAVVDHDMNTLHVFTGVEIGAIPETRKRLLRADAQQLDAQL